MSKKIIWITGASSGIGESLAKEYNAQGDFVILSARNKAQLERVQNSLTSPDQSVVVPLDVGAYDQIEKEVQPVITKYGGVDVLINNAGISQRSDVISTDLKVFEQIMNVNFMGCVGMTKAVLPHMYKQGSGNICVISSVMGKASTPMRSGYCASKHALHGFYESLRAEAIHKNVHVTMVMPGYIRTNVSVNAVTSDGSTHGKMDATQDKGMSPDELAKDIYKAVARNKAELVSGGMEVKAMTLYKYFPSLYRRFVKNFEPK